MHVLKKWAKTKLEDGVVEIKKEFICEKDARSKVLSIHVASSHSKKIDEMLKELKIDGIRNVSFKRASTEERVAVMHCNEMKNFKARYETLFNVRNRQLIKTNDETISVEQLMRNIKVNEANLF